MIPWNPIHRYAGMTSLFDSIDEQESRGATLARLDGWGDSAAAGRIRARSARVRRRPRGRRTGRRRVDTDRLRTRPRRRDRAAARLAASRSRPPAESRRRARRRCRSTSARSRSAARRAARPRPARPGRSADEVESEAGAAADEIVADASPESVEQAPEKEKVPFFKRELSFRRNSETEELPGEPVAADSETEPIAVAPGRSSSRQRFRSSIRQSSPRQSRSSRSSSSRSVRGRRRRSGARAGAGRVRREPASSPS